MDAADFLKRPRLQRIFVVHGDEDFLRRLVHQAIRKVVLGEGEDAGDFSSSAHAGDTATFAEVMDELATIPFFGERRLVVVDNADPFVTRYRAALEKAVAELPAAGVLVLDVKSWTTTTRLAKMVSSDATIACKSSNTDKSKWCIQWTAAHHQKQLAGPAANLLVDLVGPELGLLDQELLKLAIYVGDRQRIELDDVDKLVARGRLEDIWQIFNAIGASKSKEAMTILDRLLDKGEEPLRLLGAFSWQLRRLAQGYRLTMLGRPLSVALEEAGVPGFKVKEAEQQLKHIGRRRAEQIYDWLLEVDQGVKGASQLPPRTLLERLVLRLARRA